MRFVNQRQSLEWRDLNPTSIAQYLKVSWKLAQALQISSPSEEEISLTCRTGGQLCPTEGEDYVHWAQRSIKYWSIER